MSRLGFHARVLLAAVLPLVLVAVALAWYFTVTRVADLDAALRERGQVIARQLAPAAEFGVFSGNRELLQTLAQAAAREPDVGAVAVLDGDGRMLAGAGVTMTHAPRPGVMVFEAPIEHLQTRADDLFEVVRDAPSAAPSAPIGSVRVQVSRARLEQAERELIRSAALITLLGIAVAGWVARLLSKGVTQPVLTLARAVREIGEGNLQTRARIEAGGSLKVLERGINDMAAALDAARSGLERRINEATAELQTQKERAEAANRTKSHFLAAASHDLRQPLQALGLFANALRQRVPAGEAAQIVGSMDRAIVSLEGVLESLLDISRLDAGAVPVRPEDFPLAPFLARVRETFEETARNHGLRLAFAPTHAWCRSDPLLLERVVSNLVSNALRYTRRGGVVVGCRRQGGQLRLEVWDSGCGIPPDQLEAVFGEFVRVGAPGRDKGLGLGLAIVQRLVRMLDHRVAVRSRVGRGSVFSVVLPRAFPAEEAAAQVVAAEPAQMLRGRCVALLDDDPQVLEAMSGCVRAAGAHVVAAESLDSLQRQLALRGQAPDALVTDYRLGEGESGVDAAQRMRALCGGGLPVLVVTAESAPESLSRLASSGLPVLHKPVRAAALLQALAELLAVKADEPERC